MFRAKTQRRKDAKTKYAIYVSRKAPMCKENISMSENELSKIIVDTCYKIHTRIGPGLFESVYEEILSYELISKGI